MGKREKTRIRPLDDIMALLELDNFTKSFDTTMKRDIKKSWKRAISIIGPYLLFILGNICFNSVVLLVIGTLYFIVGFGTLMVRDFKKEVDKIETKFNNNDKIVTLNFEEDVDQILSRGIVTKKGEDFYKDSFKEIISQSNREKEEDLKRLQPKLRLVGLEDENIENDETHEEEVKVSEGELRLVTSQEEVLSIDEVKEQLAYEIDIYYNIYKLPPFNVSNKHWDIFFDRIYESFVNNNLEKKFYESMSEMIRFVLARALVNESKSINIDDLIYELACIVPYGIDEVEKLNIEKDIISEAHVSKVTNFAYYKKNKRRGK